MQCESAGKQEIEYTFKLNTSQTRTGHGVSILMMNYGYATIIGKS
jgi:hypothetical protein